MEDLRVLIYMNPLIVDKISKKFIHDKDSGFIYTKNLVRSLPESWRYIWLIPPSLFSEGRWFYEANKHIELVAYPYGTSIHQSRYDFYGDVLRKEFPYSRDIDVILNNQPEHAGALRSWAANQRRDNPVIMSFYHWLDVKESRRFGSGLSGYFWRQWEGYNASDFNMFHGEYAAGLFKAECERQLKAPVLNKSDYFYCPPTKFEPEPFNLNDEYPIILFNHRLNNSTGWKKVVTACNHMWLAGEKFTLWLTDDSNLKENTKLKQNPYIHIEKLSGANYGYLLRKAHFSVCAHSGYSTWNLAVLDSLENECFVLVPDAELYGDWFERYKNYLVFHDYKNLALKMTHLLNVKQTELKSRARVMQEDLGKKLSYNVSIEDHVVSMIQEKMGKTAPKGYDKVLEHIKSTGFCHKREWVNKFWEFHANSNFQRIRWRLLLDGVRDLTDRKQSSYCMEKTEDNASRSNSTLFELT